jgi:hypothetical protein
VNPKVNTDCRRLPRLRHKTIAISATATGAALYFDAMAKPVKTAASTRLRRAPSSRQAGRHTQAASTQNVSIKSMYGQPVSRITVSAERKIAAATHPIGSRHKRRASPATRIVVNTVNSKCNTLGVWPPSNCSCKNSISPNCGNPR